MIIRNRKSKTKDISNIEEYRIGLYDDDLFFFNPFSFRNYTFFCDLDNNILKYNLHFLRHIPQAINNA